MSRPFLQRLHTTASSPTPIAAQTAASHFLALTRSLPPQTQTQILDGNQLHRLAATLNRGLPSYSSGTPIPPCHHLIYFTPSSLESTLGLDGTDTAYNPPAPFTRRMWAGGEVKWVGAGAGNLLRVGDEVTEVTRVLGAEGKRTKAGEEMVVVKVEKSLENQRGVAVVDERNWIFRPALPLSTTTTTITTPRTIPAPAPTTSPLPAGPHTRDFLQTPVSLFRFSALTFNGHKIHYDAQWCRDVEGHRERVVHGPLNLINMLDLWRDVTGEAVPSRVVYRATAPIYAGERYRILVGEEGQEAGERVREVRVVDSFGRMGMRGSVVR